MQTCIVIPARYGSTRFPGKPLAKVAGKSLLERVWRISQAVKGVDSVLIATDDKRILEHARNFGAAACMTAPELANGTERVYRALRQENSNADIIVNLQGDAVLTPPWIIQAIVDSLKADISIEIATPAVRLSWTQFDELVASKCNGQAAGTLVTFDSEHKALYFSKAVIPFCRKQDRQLPSPFFRHIGLYGYRRQTLEKYLSLEPGLFEQAEQLEQLRALEHGIPVKVVLVDYRGRTHWSIDNPADIEKAVEIISKEGELIPD